MPNQRLTDAKRIVVKLGSNLITEKNGLNLDVIGAISSQVSALINRGIEVILVSSGAMAAGMRIMEMERRPDEIPKRQAISAIGQGGVMNAYEKSFAAYGKKIAQILLTGDDLNNRKRYLNARNTLHTLMDWKIDDVEIISIRIEISVGSSEINRVKAIKIIVTIPPTNRRRKTEPNMLSLFSGYFTSSLMEIFSRPSTEMAENSP